MIPRAYVHEWSAATPWPDPRQVEQDLIICRALCDIFNEPFLAERLAFRGTRPAFDDYQREAARLTDADVEAEYAAQNYFGSEVVHGKHYWVRWGIFFFLLGIGLAVGAYLLK